jgi:GH25 family lysozyme M1 (1,4-beta-N-acetylmuramidase)
VDSLETPTPTADIAALLAIIFIFRVLCLVVALVRFRSPLRRESHENSRQRSFAQVRSSKHSMMVTDVGGLAPSRRQTIVDEQGRRQTRVSFAHGASVSRRQTIVDEQGRRQTRVSFAHGASVARRQTIVDEQRRRQTRVSFAHGASVKRGPFNANLLPLAVEEVELEGPRNEAAAGSGPGAVPVKEATLSAFSTV